MAERFTKLFTTQRDLYTEGSPVILRAGALLLDTLNTKALAQLKLQSISPKKITALTVTLQPQASTGAALGDAITHTYLDLSIERDVEFGAQAPIYLPNADTRAFVAAVSKVVFSDRTVWEAQEAKWVPLAFPTRTLQELLQSPAAIEEYQRRFGLNADIMPEAVGNLWRCSCGALNHCEEKSCHRCTANLQEMRSVNAKELEQEHFYLQALSLMECGDDNSLNTAIEHFTSLGDYKDSKEKKAACEEMIVQNGINRKKAKKKGIILGSIVAGIAACAAILCMGILPGVQINKATALVEAGKDAEAIKYLYNSAGLAESFRSSQYDAIKEGIHDRAEKSAKKLIETGDYKAAYDLMSSCRCSFNDTYKLVKALNDGDYKTAVNDYGMTHIIIPKGVTSIDSSAFADCSGLTSITIPSSVTSIGSSAFSGCDGLTSVTFDANSKLTSIGTTTFYNCTSLTSITIPSGVTSIGTCAFEGCDSLTSVTFDANSQLTSIGGCAFEDCTSLTSITIPSSVTSIGIYAFYKCSSLTSITIPPSVTSIGSYAFYNCTSLTSITIPSGVTSIGICAFEGCDNLTLATFETTTGWWRAFSSTATSGTSISSADLANTSTAAAYLRSNYSNYNWKRG